MKMIATIILICTAILTAGWVIQQRAERRDTATYPPPGRMVELQNGTQIHLQEMGVHHAGPTIILEAGAALSSPSWGWIQPQIAKFAHVVAYDRPGLGWSGGEPVGLAENAQILHEALQAADIPGPYILVGYSLGGLYIRGFADAYPEEVAGLVFVDVTHEDQFEQIPAVKKGYEQVAVLARLLPALSRFGIIRWLEPVSYLYASLPEPQQAQSKAFYAQQAQLKAAAHDFLAVPTLAEEVRPFNLPDVPAVVLSAGAIQSGGDPLIIEQQHVLHQELAHRLPQATLQVAEEADHGSIVLMQAHTTAVITAVRQLVDK